MPHITPQMQGSMAAASRGATPTEAIVEMNTGAISRKVKNVPYPADFLLPEILHHGGKIILSSDAHRAENIAFWFDEAVELLRANGFTSIVQLRGGRFEEVGI